MTPARFRALCSSLGDVEARPHFDRTAFRTPARNFATLAADGADANVRLPLEVQQVLVDSRPDLFSPCSGAWGASGWTRMELAGVDEATCREVLREAHTFAAPKVKAAKTRAKKKRTKARAKR